MTASKYFSEEELQCHCGCGSERSTSTLRAFLDELRETYGAPLNLSCSTRCETHNAEVGGVSNSQHCECSAADVLVPEGMTVDKLADLAIGVGFDGIGRYYNSGFVHCDVRDDGNSPNCYTWTDQD